MGKMPLTSMSQQRFWQQCQEFNQQLDKLAKASREPAQRIRRAVGMLFTTTPVGYYYHPQTKLAGVMGLWDLPTNQQGYVLSALTKVAEVAQEEVSPLDSQWIKVAYSPFLRGAGELLHFFPGYKPESVTGIPNSPGPFQAMLASGLVGAGLGYGTGWLGEQLMPRKWKKGRLRKTLAVLGGLGGVLPGAVWAGANVAQGLPIWSSKLLDDAPTGNWTGREATASDQLLLGQYYKTASAQVAQAWREGEQALLKEAFGSGLAYDPQWVNRNLPASKTPLSVNVNSLGQTLYQVGASPLDAMVTMGALFGAQQMPGGKGPGWVTPKQMALLAAKMGAGYLSGGLVGAVLGGLTGLPPEAQTQLKRTGAYLGIVQDVVPKLFGGD